MGEKFKPTGPTMLNEPDRKWSQCKGTEPKERKTWVPMTFMPEASGISSGLCSYDVWQHLIRTSISKSKTETVKPTNGP